MSDLKSRLDHFFGISARESTFSREIRGGLATFFTMAYIVVLNPIIIATAQDVQKQYIGDGTAGPNVALVRRARPSWPAS